MDVILHLGAHRCATTTLQTFLGRNAAVLATAGIDLWLPARTRAGLFAGLTGDGAPLNPRRGDRATGLIRIETARAGIDGTRQLIVSEPNMIGSARTNLRQRQLYPALDQRLARFRAAFGGRVTRIGLAIRSYDSFWASSLAEAVDGGQRMPDPGLLDSLVTQPRRWRDTVCDIAATLPGAEIVVWPFERFAAQPERQLAILTAGQTSGLTLSGSRDWQHPSPRLTRLRDILRQRGDAATLPDGNDRWMPFDADQQATLRARYRADLAWLRDGAGGLARLIENDTIRPATTGAAMPEETEPTATNVITGAVRPRRPKAGGTRHADQGPMG